MILGPKRGDLLHVFLDANLSDLGWSELGEVLLLVNLMVRLLRPGWHLNIHIALGLLLLFDRLFLFFARFFWFARNNVALHLWSNMSRSNSGTLIVPIVRSIN